MRAPSIENVFARSWELLTRNAIIIVPGLVIGVVAGVLGGIVNPPAAVDPTTGLPSVGLAARAGGGLLAGAISLLAQVLTIAYTTGMAGAAWSRGSTSLDDGTRAFREEGGRIFVAMLIYAAIALVLTFLTFGLGVLLFAFFAIYAMPAVVLRNVGAFVALRESFAIATQRWVPTLIVIVLICVVVLVAAVLAGVLAIVPLLGPIVAAVLLQAIVAYVTIVVVGEYLALRGDVPPVTSPPPPAPPY